MKDDQASLTALAVLQGLLYTARHSQHKHLVSDNVVMAAENILQASKAGKKRLQQLDSALFRWLAPKIEALLMPGITLHYALRKRFIEDATRNAIEKEGITQVINLGAGFDALAWCLHKEHPEVNFIEIDHPATNALKAQALLKGEEKPANLNLLAVDFSKEKLEQALTQCEYFDPSRPTWFICEGVLMYLDQADVKQVFQSIIHLTGKDTQLIFTSVAPMQSSENNVGKLLKWYLKYASEPLNWLCEPADISHFVVQQNFALTQLATTSVLQQLYARNEPIENLHKGEYIVIAHCNKDVD